MLRAVLTDAIECYQQQFLGKEYRSERLAKEAEAWLFSNDESWPFAFVISAPPWVWSRSMYGVACNARLGLRQSRRSRNSGTRPRFVAFHALPHEPEHTRKEQEE